MPHHHRHQHYQQQQQHQCLYKRKLGEVGNDGSFSVNILYEYVRLKLLKSDDV